MVNFDLGLNAVMPWISSPEIDCDAFSSFLTLSIGQMLRVVFNMFVVSIPT